MINVPILLRIGRCAHRYPKVQREIAFLMLDLINHKVTRRSIQSLDVGLVFVQIMCEANSLELFDKAKRALFTLYRYDEISLQHLILSRKNMLKRARCKNQDFSEAI